MKRHNQGNLRRVGSGIEAFRAFIPAPLPPNPPPQLGGPIQKLHADALLAIGRLDGLTRILPDVSLILYFYSRKEAVLSSQIEGTQSTLSELLLFETDKSLGGSADVLEVSNYVAALQHGLQRIKGGFPLSLRLFREMHKILLTGTRGHERTPGEFRTSQNWLGGKGPSNARYVPPPVDELSGCLDAFEKFMHNEGPELSPLLEAGLLHQQFETIHPFLDGNGRLGRMLITLLLVARGVLQEPILYTSLYLKENRDDYYDALQLVRETGDWEQWLEFFFQAVLQSAQRGVEMAHQIMELFAKDTLRIQQERRKTDSALRLYQALQRSPYLNARDAVKMTGLNYLTVLRALAHLGEMGLVNEVSGRSRGRIWVYSAYLRLLAD